MINIKMFNKLIVLDEENEGIGFMIHELCEFPLENWAICEYKLIYHVNSNTAENNLLMMEHDALMEFVVNAIIHTIDVSSLLDESICRKYSDAIRRSYSSYVWDNYK